ncbi:PstS family phosphate ABC transporter substrate-binding protein [Candidatus Poriferisodalis sp.]|uniref:PstS family phosphate ABC transporter substrate-binding protein n=1 Tax=Candidatus Poriferisodalis sp. TaxID=3101277 RepID=UPI003B016F19
MRKTPLSSRRGTKLLVALLTAFALVAAACGSDDDSSDGDSGTARVPSTTAAAMGDDAMDDGAHEEGGMAESISGSINVTGSSTVEPVTNLLAEAFSERHPDVAFSVSGPGSGDGHKAAAAGEVPIWNSSRQIKDSEAEDINAAGIEFIELRVGIDGISVITVAGNDKIDCLNFEDLYSLVGIEATGFDSWADANSLNAELGGTGPFPDGALEIFAPGEESGTFDSFIEIALEGVWEHRVEEGHADENFAVRPDYNASANDNVIIDGIAGNQHSLGWVGFAFADENRDKVKLVEVDGGDGCVAPTPETIASAEFPIARFLYTYIDASQASDPAVKTFVDFMLSDEGQTYVVDAGYVNLDPADLEQSRSNWANLTTGKTFP